MKRSNAQYSSGRRIVVTLLSASVIWRSPFPELQTMHAGLRFAGQLLARDIGITWSIASAPRSTTEPKLSTVVREAVK
jgi:hypothetical protein